MFTTTYNTRHWPDEDTGGNGDCFEVVANVTRHAITGDEWETFTVASFGTLTEANEFLQAINN